jgi:TolB-like protein/DNA-binding winged helix-turn-helix (wHTH) protein/Tfp pilus assembly protein PilF
MIQAAPVRLRLPGFELDLRTGELLSNGRRRALQEQPFRVLQMLLEHPGDLVTRTELQKRLWPTESYVDFEHGLNKAVGKLRDALAEPGEACTLIETLPRRGYRFIGTVEPVYPEATAGAVPVPETTTAAPGWSRRLKAAVIGGCGAVLLALAINVPNLRARFLTSPPIRSIAVLPLRNLSGSADQDYFADGITDELITNLARISSLRVVSSLSAQRYHDPAGGIGQVARELNVEAIVEGSVARSGDHVRIIAQLIDARTDSHIWAQSYERELGEILKVQDDVAHDIARELKVTLRAGEQESAGERKSVAPQAYDAYLRGRNELGKQSRTALLKSVQFFQQAIDAEPLYSPAYAALADAYSLLANYSVLPSQEAFPRANAAARRALELDPDSADAHTALAYVLHHYDLDWEGAASEYRRALELSPHSAVAHLRYSEFLSTLGRGDDALAEVRQAQADAPLSLVIAANVGRVLYHARRYDEAVAQTQRLLLIAPDRAYARIHLAMAYEQKGDCAKAIEEMQRAVAQMAEGDGPGLAHIYARCGRVADARRILALLEQDADSIGGLIWLAGVHAELGETSQALGYLEKAYQSRDFFLPFARVHPYMDPLRGDPRFLAIMEKMGPRGCAQDSHACALGVRSTAALPGPGSR